jgi:predicted esterase
LVEEGLNVEFHEFNGGHTIPGGVIDALGAFVTRVTDAR